MTPQRPVDQNNVLQMVDELNVVLRQHGFAIDIGDGEFNVYLIDHYGNDAVAHLSWVGRGLRVEFVPDSERWSVADEDWLKKRTSA